MGLLAETIESLREADAVYLIDNGSTDQDARVVRDRWPHVVRWAGRLHTSGHGTNLQARVLEGDGADLRVHSDDDMWWRPGWRDRLEAWWGAASPKVALTGCHIEPDYPWTPITAKVSYGGVPGLVRGSTGAASWTYPGDLFPKLFPIPSQRQGWGDVPACRRIIDHLGMAVCQVDLAEHHGPSSTWGNRTVELHGDDNRAVLDMLTVTP
jgi:hypothetical protein